MDQIDRLVFDVVGRDRGGSKVLQDSAKHADAAHQSMSKLGSTLSGLGGPFEQITSLAGGLGDAFEGTVGKTAKLGLGLAAAGVALTAFGAKDAQAQKQLQQTVDNTGQSYSDYRAQIEEAIRSQEKNAHTADDTQNALNTLTTANQDVTKSLSEMAFVADLAAQKHENLAQAAQQLVLMEGGNTRAFRSFGITLDTTKDRATEVDKALHTLQDRLSGQASAAVDTTTGKFKVWGVELEDDIARLSKFGPALTIGGAALTAYAATVQIMAARKIAETAATNAQTASEERLAAARTAGVGAIERETIATTELTTAQARNGMLGGRGFLKGAATLTAGLTAATVGYELVKSAAEHPAYHVDPHGQIRSNSDSALAPAGKFGAVNIPNTQPGGRATGLKQDTAATNNATTAADAYATALLNEKAAATQAANSIDGHLKRLEDTVKLGMNLSSAQDGMSTSMHNLAQSIHDGSTALKGYSTNAINNRGALRDVVTQELDVIQALRDHHVSADKVTSAAAHMSRAIENNATKLGLDRTAVRNLLRDLDVLPGQIEKALSATAVAAEKTGRELVDFYASGIYAESPVLAQAGKYAQAQAMKGLRLGDSALGGGPTQSYTTPDPKAVKAANDAGKQIAHDVVAGAAPAIDSGINDATTKALDKVKQQAQAMAALEKQTAQQIAGAYQATKKSLIDAASLANRQQGTDLFGSPGPAESILASKRQFAHQMVQFARLIHRLEDAHYNPTVIDEVEGLGTVAGIEAAQELLAGGRKERRQVNRAEARIERASGRISSQITGQDFNAEILKTLQRLPTRMQHALVQALRHEKIFVDVSQVDHKQGRKVRTH